MIKYLKNLVNFLERKFPDRLEVRKEEYEFLINEVNRQRNEIEKLNNHTHNENGIELDMRVKKLEDQVQMHNIKLGFFKVKNEDVEVYR